MRNTRTLTLLFSLLAFFCSCSEEENMINIELITPNIHIITNTPIPQEAQIHIQGREIYCHFPVKVEKKEFILTFSEKIEKIFINNQAIISGKTIVDLTTSQEIIIIDKDGARFEGIIIATAQTGLPTITINTNGCQQIFDKEDYVEGIFTLTTYDGQSYNLQDKEIRIKAHGNSTVSFLEKQPYNIKFNVPTKIFDCNPETEFILLANYFDKSLLRNSLASYIGNLSNQVYTPKGYFVDLILNGEKKGCYQLYEKIKASTSRVNVGTNGYLLEIDARVTQEDTYVKIGTIPNPIEVIHPYVSQDSPEVEFIQTYFENTEQVLFGDDFSHPLNGYSKYIDTEQFIEWYLVNEITINADACFFSSCYMHLPQEGKLTMGPIWDFDLSLGLVGNPFGYDESRKYNFHIKNVQWYQRLFQDPAFIAKVKERYNYFYQHKEDILNHIDATAQYIKYSVMEGHNHWYETPTEEMSITETYQIHRDEIERIKRFLSQRMDWLKEEFDRM